MIVQQRKFFPQMGEPDFIFSKPTLLIAQVL